MLVLAAASLVAAATASAQTGQPASVDQYLEAVPTGGGPKASDAAAVDAALPEAAREALSKARPETASVLAEVATSSSYGAPRPAETSEQGPLSPGSDPHTGASVNETLQSAATSVTDTRLLGLLVAILVTTLGAVALAIGRARAEAR
jgi:hypothetical protein